MGTYMVSHKLLRRFMISFRHGRMPIYVFHTIYVREKRDEGLSCEISTFSYNKFKDAWYSYLELLDIDIDQGFGCEICKNASDIVLMDATSLSFRKELTHWRSFLVEVEQTKEPVIPRYSKFENRIMVSNNTCRSLLLRYVDNRRRKSKRLNMDEYDEMLEMLEDLHPSIFLLIKYLEHSCTDMDHDYWESAVKGHRSQPYCCPKAWAPFVEALAVATPVAGIIHQDSELQNGLGNFVSEGGIVDRKVLDIMKRKFPVLYDLVTSLQDFKCPEPLLSVLQLMVEKSRNPFLRQPKNQAESLRVSREKNEASSSIAHWPDLPQKRHRGRYQIDQNRVSKKQNVCTKTSRGHPSLLPGVFTLFCNHEICYGFEVMTTSESPEVPFNVLFTHFEKAPKVVIYDNACNLHEYCLNRQPSFFQETRFLVDRLHWKNHSGCSEGYNMDRYLDLKGINSQTNIYLHFPRSFLIAVFVGRFDQNLPGPKKLASPPLRMAEHLRKQQEMEDTDSNYPHNYGQITKESVATKLKVIRQKYRAAVDSGKKS
ncbi:uncharacterized protein LOC135690945 [Rhopilema esculentum]|uniref:uncharacterized protein LOC135690945 n=1 Tax=Rhopilema esculentum TaxID=499914 RepID=UPI0031D8A133